jgi:uncharacterized membrane protein YbhN (UPF0104 family)
MLRAAKYLGTCLALAFVALLIWRSAGEMPTVDLRSGAVWAALAGAVVFYAASQVLGAMAWRATLAIYDVRLPPGRAESQLLVSQIGKYIPGNIAHFLGRAVLARADGAGGAAIAGALLLEVAFLFVAAVLTVGGLLLLVPGLFAALAREIPGTGIGAVAVAAGLGLLMLFAAGQVLLWTRAGRPRIVPVRFAEPIFLYLGNFAVLGVSLWCAASIMDPGSGVGVVACTVIFAAAWVAGFLMPGAPGGVGVRDGIIAIGLELFMAPGAALGVALLHRGVSVLGDLVVFAAGLALRRALVGEANLGAR